MKTTACLAWVAAGLASMMGASCALADTHYVSLTGSNLWPYASWESAARNIQDAVDTAIDGDTVLLADGRYTLQSTIAIYNKDITLESANGVHATTIDGDYPNRTNACLYLNDCNITLRGITIANGFARGGPGGDYGGGVCLDFGSGGLIQNCAFVANRASANGGGGYRSSSARVLTFFECTFSNNVANGGGAFLGDTGGGADFYRCIIYRNSASLAGGVFGGTLRSCLLVGNTASSGAAVHSADLVNCTVVSNDTAGFAVENSTSGHYALNSIIVGNTRNGTTPDANYDSKTHLYFCCTTPQVPDAQGNNNFTLDPLFVNAATNDFRLSPASQCINTGSNQTWMASATDLLGNPRLFNGVVDRGAYESPSDSLPLNAVEADIGLGVEIIWGSQSGIRYWIQASNNMPDTNSWQTIDQRIGNGGEMTAIYSARNQPYRYFRVTASQ